MLREGEGQVSCESENYAVTTKLQWKKITGSGEEAVPDNMVTNVIDKKRNLIKAILNITNDGGSYKCEMTDGSSVTGPGDTNSIRMDGIFVLDGVLPSGQK